MSRFVCKKFKLIFILLLGASCSYATKEPKPSEITNLAAKIKFELVASNLEYLVDIEKIGTAKQDYLVIGQSGLIHLLQKGKSKLVLDLSKEVTFRGEMGLLGIAVHPDFYAKGFFGYHKFYLHYSTRNSEGKHIGRIEEFEWSDSFPDKISLKSRRVLLEVLQPNSNHNGGSIVFHPTEKLLYIAFGDGGNGNDSGTGHHPILGNAQDLESYLGKILRISVEPENGAAYAIPESNPFLSTPSSKKEIYAYGLRNPFRIHFEKSLDDPNQYWLFAADVGQNAVEEVDLITAGGNYGWKFHEGPIVTPKVPPFKGKIGPFIPPILSYPSSLGKSVISGAVYYGNKVKDLTGKLVFADYYSPYLFIGSYQPNDKSWKLSQITNVTIEGSITSFDSDDAGEILFTTHQGNVYKIAND